MRRTFAAAALITIAGVFSAGPTSALDFATDALTQARVSGQVGGNLPSRFSETQDDSTTLDYTFAANAAVTSPGSLHGDVSAGFGELRVLLELTGPSGLSASARASFNEVFTISSSGGGSGSGQMQVFFGIHGSTEVWDNVDPTAPGASPIYNDPSFADSSFTVRQGSDTVVNTVDDYFHGESSGGPPGGAVATVDFTYGVPFNLAATLSLAVSTDNVFQGFSGGVSRYGGGAVQYVKMDFSHTAAITRIVLPDETDVLGSVSGFDYAPFLVPEPQPVLLFAGALLGLALLARR